MSTARRRREPGDLVPYVGAGAVGLALLAIGGLWVAGALAHELGEAPAPPNNPFAFAVELVTGERSWPGMAATVIIVVELVVLLAVGEIFWWSVKGWQGRRARVDAAARHLASRRELARLSERGAAATAERLGAKASTPGILVGTVVGTGQPLYGSWEDMHVDIWGTRTGKTTSRAIPTIVSAPGAVLVTSNKRDVVDATRGVREGHGQVWMLDPQDLIGEKQTWYYDLLSYVIDVDHAKRLAKLLSDYSRPLGAKQDGYFDPKGETLLSFLLLAAAVAGEPVTTVYRWVNDPTDTEPVQNLHDAGHTLPAQGVQGVINLPDKQRGGIYGSAERSVDFLTDPKVARWAVPAPGLRPFIPAEFVNSTDTLYSLSQEGRANAGPLVAAVNVATIEAAEEKATRSPGGRLAVPFVAELDEAANTCRWRDLPYVYSHYGSRGIIVDTILQSWPQGVLAWGEGGMEQLWDSANIRVYGGGAMNTKFLGDLEKLIGTYRPTTTSVSVQRGQGSNRSTTTSLYDDQVLDVADLSSLERGRALVFPSGSRPALIKTVPWHMGPYADAIRASIAKYAPADEQEQHELAAAGDGGGGG